MNLHPGPTKVQALTPRILCTSCGLLTRPVDYMGEHGCGPALPGLGAQRRSGRTVCHRGAGDFTGGWISPSQAGSRRPWSVVLCELPCWRGAASSGTSIAHFGAAALNGLGKVPSPARCAPTGGSRVNSFFSPAKAILVLSAQREGGVSFWFSSSRV